jgi:hypothetical protein
MEEKLRGLFLPIAADTLDDLEGTRIQLENRIRALTRSEEDKDGQIRGPGLSEDHPDVARLLDLLENVKADEHDAELYLKRVFRNHPLYPWCKDARGIGEKQGARLLAAIGDPYIRPDITYDDGSVEAARPRRGPDELKAYCGMDVRDGAAPTRRKGVKANWNAVARKRLWLVSESCMKAGGPYREVYDDEREHYADAVHDRPCVRCGPSGKPAKIGSPLNDGHKHARALRKVGQTILIDLYRESERIYQDRGWLKET